MSKQYYDVEIFFKKSTFVRVYASNKKEAKERAKNLSPEKDSSIRKYFEVLGEDNYIEGSWQVGSDITAIGQNGEDWSNYDSVIKTVEDQVIHCQKHSK